MRKGVLAALAVVILSSCGEKNDQQISSYKMQVADGQVCEVTVYSPSIVRVLKYPAGTTPEKSSYSVIMDPQSVKCKVDSSDASLEITTECLRVNVDKATGAAQFFAPDGHQLLAETGTSFDQTEREADREGYKITQSWKLDADEAIYGLGQRQRPNLNQRGEVAKLWNDNKFINIPFFLSEKGYGLYWDNPGMTTFDDSGAETKMISETGKASDLYFMYKDGTADGVISCVRALSGSASVLPLWAHGFFQCKERYKTAKELSDVLDKYRELGIPLDGIVQDWKYWGLDTNWNAMAFLNEEYKAEMSPEDMIKHVHDQNAHLMISVWPSFGANTPQYKEMDAIGAILPFHTWPLDGGVRPYDPFNPEAREIYWKYLQPLVAMGMDMLWTDATEPDHFYETVEDDDYRTHDGTWRSVRNAYSIVTNRSIYEHRREMEPNKRAIQMTRSAALGLQHYGTFSWSGDILATWEAFKCQIPSGLNYSICGIPYWNTDIGGFGYWQYADQSASNPYLQEMQVRWMQWAVYTPLMRNHCSSPMESEMFLFGGEGDWPYDEQVRAVKARYQILPYVYSLGLEAAVADGTMMRPFVMDFIKDRKALQVDDEYMFGKAFLVKPITDPMYTAYTEKDGKCDYKAGMDAQKVHDGASEAVSVYLPAGADWWDWNHRDMKYEGGKEVTLEYDITCMPVFVRAGSIVPQCDGLQYVPDGPLACDLTIEVFPGADGDYVLYEDAGDGYGYEKGEFSKIPFHWDDATKTLTIGKREGSFPGMIKSRTFIISGLGEDITVIYNGSEQKVK